VQTIKITDIQGIKVGHAQDVKGGSGCTVVLCEAGAVAGVDVRGGAPATRETDLLRPVNTVEKIHAVMLSGGSAYGLDAAAGAMSYLEEKGIGFDMEVAVVPIVCGASLFDLNVGDPKCRPDQKMGYAACQNASKKDVEEGNVGAGTGATVGKLLGPKYMMKSGLGSYGVSTGAIQVAAIVAVNAVGDVVCQETGKPIAGLLNEDGTRLMGTEQALCSQYGQTGTLPGGNTTIGCVVTNVKLTKTQATKIASVAHNGLARSIRPVHTSMDGDTLFVMSTGEVEASPDLVGVLATQAVEQAVVRSVTKAESAYGIKSAREIG
jgi:L-aminopeptidase/D-esterase-like protein